MRILLFIAGALALAEGRTLNEAGPATPINSAYTFTAASASLDRATKTLTLAGVSPVVTGSVADGGDAMPLRLATAEVFGPGRFLPIFAGPGAIQALLDGDVGAAGQATPPQPARVALQLTPGSAKFDGKANTLTLGIAAEGPVVEAGVQDGGLVKGALTHTAPEVKESGKKAVKLDAAALTIDVAVPQAPMALARAKARASVAAAPAAAPAKTGVVAAASVP